MHISLLTPGITPYVTGGLQRHSFNLARSLAKLGVTVDLYHTDFKGEHDISKLAGMSIDEKKNINSICVPWKIGRMPGKYVQALKQFSEDSYSIYKTREPTEFIIAKSLTGWAFVGAKQSGAKLPPIGVNFHGYEMFQTRPTLRTRLESVMLKPPFSKTVKAADFVFSYGAKITDLLERRLQIPRSRIINLPGGTDPDLHVESPSDISTIRRFIFLGRYERRKGIEELNKAITSNKKWKNLAEFLFVGPIPAEKQLALTNITYTGPLSDQAQIQEYLHSSDVLLCPSHSEGMPNAIMEAMAAGLAIIATDVGAVRLLVSSENGVLLDSSSAASISAAIENVIQLPDTNLAHMKHASHSKIEKFFWPAIGEMTRDALSKAIQSGH